MIHKMLVIMNIAFLFPRFAVCDPSPKELYENGIKSAESGKTDQEKQRGGQDVLKSCEMKYSRACMWIAEDLTVAVKEPGKESKQQIEKFKGLVKDYYKKTLEYSEAGCASGNGDECDVYGTVQKFKENKAVALKYFRQACDLNYAESCYSLGMMLAESGAKPAELAVLYAKACDQGIMGSCHNLAWIEKNQLSKPESAQQHYKKGCEANYLLSCVNLGLIDEEAGNLGLAVENYEKACNGGELDGCQNLGIYHEDKGDLKTALNFFDKVCRGGDQTGCHGVGSIYLKQKNKPLAKKFLKQACEAKESVQEACNELATMEPKRNVSSENSYADRKKRLRKNLQRLDDALDKLQ